MSFEGEQHTNFDAATPICSVRGSQLEQDLKDTLELLGEWFEDERQPQINERTRSLLARLNGVC